MKEKKLTKKERLFCYHFVNCRNAREAASFAGYAFPSSTGNKLLEKQSIKREIDKINKNYPIADEIKSGFRRLAFGSTADCIKLLFQEDITQDNIEEMDLFNISEIKKAKNGNIEIKFFDRLKALEQLSVISEMSDTDSVVPFYEAIRKGAAALNAAEYNV